MQTRALRIAMQATRPAASAIAHALSATLATTERRARHTRDLRTATAVTKRTASATRHVLCATRVTLDPLASHVCVR
jgi:hypothetical protein